MNRSLQLYNLINSLSRGEKRHYKLLSSKYSKGGKNIQVSLFDTFDGLREWDEELFSQKLKKTGLNKHISVHINTLIEQVLNSLRVQEQKNNSVFIINKLIEESYLLYGRDEFELGLKRIKKAKDIASKSELFIKMNEILNQEREIQFRRLNNEDYNVFRLKYNTEVKHSLDMLKNENDYMKLVEDIFYIYRSIGYPQKEIEKTKYAEILENPLLKDDSLALCSNAKSSYHFVYTLYYLGLSELEKASEVVKKQVAIYEKNPAFVETHINTYISILNNLLVLQSQLDKERIVEDFKDTLRKIRSLPSKYKLENSFIKWRIFETSYSAELDFYIFRNMIDDMTPAIPIVIESAKKMGKNGFSFERFLNLALRIAIYYYRTNQLDEAHKWVNKILDNSASKSMIHIISYTMILDLVLHFKYGNYNYLEYRIQTVLNFFKKRKRLIKSNEIFFKALKQIIKTNNLKEAKYIIQKYVTEFNECPDSITKRYYKKYLLIEDWAESNFDIEQKFTR